MLALCAKRNLTQKKNNPIPLEVKCLIPKNIFYLKFIQTWTQISFESFLYKLLNQMRGRNHTFSMFQTVQCILGLKSSAMVRPV